MKRLGLATSACVAAISLAAPARAQTAEAPAATAEPQNPALARFEERPSGYVRLFVTAAAGFGIRFNNPYRLSTQLGEDASSASISAPYLDLALSVVTGDPDGIQHGGSVHVGSSLDGVVQPFVTPSYVLAYRASLPILIYGRLATPILLAPDVNVGGEVAGSISYFFTSGIGVTSEVVFDLFYGAATLEKQYSVIPVLSFQLGVIADYEFLP